MVSPQKLPVVISARGANPTEGSVELRIWQKGERRIRGLKALGISWGLAVVSVFIPLLHFVLVPLLLLAGPFAFFVVSAQERVILGGQGECPECNQTFRIVRSQVKWPLSDLCNHCQASLQIRQATQ